MTQNLKAELEKLDEQIRQQSETLKRLKKARRKVAGALEQLTLAV